MMSGRGRHWTSCTDSNFFYDNAVVHHTVNRPPLQARLTWKWRVKLIAVLHQRYFSVNSFDFRIVAFF